METKIAHDSSGQIPRLSRALRGIAGIVLLTAAVVFLCQGWAGFSSIGKVLTFISLIAAIGGTGIFCGLGLKEDKGARVSLAVSAAIIPAAFAQIGALLLSVLGAPVSGIPELFLFKAPSIGAALLTLGVAVVLLCPIMFMSFSALARTQASKLFGFYLAANAFLLIPVREPGLVALLVIAMGALYLFGEIAHFTRHSELRTKEGLMCRIMMLTPLAIVVERNFLLYSPDAIFISSVLFVIASTFFFLAPNLLGEGDTTRFSQRVGSVFFALSWMIFADGLFFQKFAPLLSQDFYVPVVIMPIGLVVFALSLIAIGGGSGFRLISGLITISSVLVQLVTVEGIFSSLLCITAAILIVALGISMEEKGLFVSGIFGVGVGILYHIKYAVELYTLSPWLSLSIIGIVTLIASSYIERNFSRIQGWHTGIRRRFSSL